jgi:isoleucyl-tRNA synthetase
VSDLSNWYVRRTRRRFWNAGGVAGADAEAAAQTLHHCLVTVATLLAPFVPFLAEELWRNLGAGRGGMPDSVHLADYPLVDDDAADPALDRSMALARAVVELGRRIRVETKTKTRQPLHEAVVHVPGRDAELDGLLDVIADELNVKAVRFADTESFGAWRAKPNYKVLGPALGGRVQAVAAALLGDDGSLAGRLASGETVTLTLKDASTVTLQPDQVDLAQEVMSGWGVASESGVTVALELEISAELRREGIARDLIRAIQDLRKAAGPPRERSDRRRDRDARVGRRALDAHRDEIAAETLAVELVLGEIPDAIIREVAEIEEETATVSLKTV